MSKLYTTFFVGLLAVSASLSVHNFDKPILSQTSFSKVTELSEEEQADYERECERKYKMFQLYQSVITDVTVDGNRRDLAIVLAEDLFFNPNQVIEVGYVVAGKTVRDSYTVPKYFKRLRERTTSTYTKVEITYFKPIELVENFKEQTFGIYKGYYKASYKFYQKFQGFTGKANNILLYGDETTKNLEIYADKNAGRVKLGNITIDAITNVTVGRILSPKGVSQSGDSANEKISPSQYNTQLELQNAEFVIIQGKNGTVLSKMPVSEFKNRLSFGEYTTSSIKETVGKQVFVQL